MNKIEAIRIYQLLTSSKFDKVEMKEDRFALLDIVLILGKAFDEYAEAEKQASETISNDDERVEYMGRIAMAEFTETLPEISKDSVYELIDSNSNHLTLGAVGLLNKLVKD